MPFAATRRAFVYGLAAALASPGARAADSSAAARVATSRRVCPPPEFAP